MSNLDTKLPWMTPLRIVIIAMLAWALIPANPYGYYVFLRWVSCPVFIYLAVAAHRAQQPGWLLLFAINAGVYNPLFGVHLGHAIWSVVNIVSICLVAASFRQTFLPHSGGNK